MKRLLIMGTLIPMVLGLLIGISTANAQHTNNLSSPQSGYDLAWYTIAGGGATFSTGRSFSLGGSLGQPDAGSLSGDSYTLSGGFWDSVKVNYNIYLPLVRNESSNRRHEPADRAIGDWGWTSERSEDCSEVCATRISPSPLTCPPPCDRKPTAGFRGSLLAFK